MTATTTFPPMPWVRTTPGARHMAICHGCGTTIPRPAFPLTIEAFSLGNALELLEHLDCGPRPRGR